MLSLSLNLGGERGGGLIKIGGSVYEFNLITIQHRKNVKKFYLNYYVVIEILVIKLPHSLTTKEIICLVMFACPLWNNTINRYNFCTYKFFLTNLE